MNKYYFDFFSYFENIIQELKEIKKINLISVVFFISIIISGFVPNGHKLVSNMILFFPLFLYFIISILYFGTKFNKIYEYSFYNFITLFNIIIFILCISRFLQTSKLEAFFYLIYPISLFIVSLYIFIKKKVEIHYIIIFFIILYDCILGFTEYPSRAFGAFASILSGAVILPLLLLISNNKSKFTELILIIFILFDIIFLKRSGIGLLTLLFVTIILNLNNIGIIFFNILKNKYNSINTLLLIFCLIVITLLLILSSFIFPRPADFIRVFNISENLFLINFIPAGIMTSGSFASNFFNVTNNEGFLFQTYYEIGLFALFYWFFIFMDKNHNLKMTNLKKSMGIIFFQLYILASFFISGVYQNPLAFIFLILAGYQLIYKNE